VAGGDRAEAVRGEGDGVADWRGRLVSDARVRESDGEFGWRVGSGSSERERESSWGGLAHALGSRPEVGREGGGRPRVWAENRPSQGGKVSPFFNFLFPFSISIFYLLSS
jgi:hypothetical protein